MSNTSADDRTLIERFKNGDEDAFDQLVRKYSNRAYSIAYGILANREDAEEVAQDVFIRIHRALPFFRGDSKFTTWMYRIARNTAFDHISRREREKNNLPTTSINEKIAEMSEIPAEVHNPEDEIINQQEYDKWLNNIEKLKDDYRLVARMNLIDNFGYKEIADELDLPINTVKTKIRRAKALLLKMMEVSDELL